MVSLVKKILYIFFISSILTIISIIILFSIYLFKPLNIDTTTTTTTTNTNNNSGNIKYGIKYFIIEHGQSVNKIADNLKKEHIISYPKLLRIALFLLDKDNKIHTGEYEVTAEDNIYSLIRKISTGSVTQYKFRIEEGESISSVLARLKEQKKLNFDFKLDNINKYNFIFLDSNLDYSNTKISNNKIIKNNLNIKLEGMLFPDTYFYRYQDKASSILLQANIKLLDYINKLWELRKLNNNYIKNKDWYNKAIPTKYDALILASILEKEASNHNERVLISGVVYNRLNKNMRLQLDPTVIYAMGDNYQGKISKQDLNIDSPYNTYKIKTMPPTPIGMASLSSLEAAINPDLNNYLYFVATGDGLHIFSENLEDHNKSVVKYQINNTKLNKVISK